jgi:putative Holliday junction resolvase
MSLQRLMGIDHGERRIGVALTDPLQLFASPHSIIDVQNAEKVLETLRDLITTENVARVVIGLPTASDGGVGKQAALVIHWARALKPRINVPIILWDESYSSEIAAGLAGQRTRRGEPIDDIAAAAILQEYLDAREAGEDEPGQTLESYHDIQ